MAELVMLDFIGSGIPILPVHDSFLVHEGHREFLTKSMQASLVKVCGVKTQLKLVEPDLGYTLANQAEEQRNDPDGFGPETSLDIAKILLAQSGHDKRLDAFYALRNH
ncbi:hypothetical protein [Salipiger mangrovisoli]|uniref:Uncharacterized protein n=1 Tax=Salipiger mangrovisoli TaxID=2865933 RepID=A0ABR9XBH6_9RHOB|nr:hypothetical protein [Salipiger mangrovisoli]MBE9640974.1 hypothetical protein [Salipiger mangrovisoli]